MASIFGHFQSVQLPACYCTVFELVTETNGCIAALFNAQYGIITGWLGSRVVSVLDSGAEGPGSNRSRNAVS